MTGKLFEYLASSRPVLMIDPTDGDAAIILKETGGGFAAEFKDEVIIRQHLEHLFKLFQEGQKYIPGKKIIRYSR